MAMMKKSITVTDQQNNWIKAQIETIRAKLIKAEESGFTDQSSAEILREIKTGLGRDEV